MTLHEIKRWILESPIWLDGGEIRQELRVEEPPAYIKRRGSPVAPGTINTDLRWSADGTPEIYKNHRVIQTSFGPVRLPIYHVYRRKVGEKGPPKDLLVAVKSLSYPGADELLNRAVDYIHKSLVKLGIKATLVVPAPSTKPLSKLLAVALAQRLGAANAELFCKSAEAKLLAPASRLGARLVDLKPGAAKLAEGHDVMLVDDLATSDQTVSQMAGLLWNQSAPKTVQAVVLIGRA